MMHNIQIILYVHPQWVVLHIDIVNAFNIISRKVIFQKLQPIGG
jgi:hypothetical protein